MRLSPTLRMIFQIHQNIMSDDIHCYTLRENFTNRLGS